MPITSLGANIATEYIAHFNTSALQQLPAFFVGTLQHPYNSTIESSTFLVDQGILEKTLILVQVNGCSPIISQQDDLCSFFPSC